MVRLRPYQPGDDFRRVDWNVYGRLGTLRRGAAARRALAGRISATARKTLGLDEVANLPREEAIAAVPDILQMEQVERFVPRLSFARLQAVIPPRDPVALRDALIRMRQEAGDYDRTAIRAEALCLYGPEAFARRFAEIVG